MIPLVEGRETGGALLDDAPDMIMTIKMSSMLLWDSVHRRSWLVDFGSRMIEILGRRTSNGP